MESYGVVWQENERGLVAGKLELDCDGLRLEGNDRDHLTVCVLAYRELAAVRIDRESTNRLDSRPTLVLERSNGDTIHITALVQAGIVTEIAERLAAFEARPRMHAAG